MDDKLKTAIQEVVESETDSFLAQLDEAPHEFRRSYEDSARRLIRRRKKHVLPADLLGRTARDNCDSGGVGHVRVGADCRLDSRYDLRDKT